MAQKRLWGKQTGVSAKGARCAGAFRALPSNHMEQNIGRIERVVIGGLP